MSHALRQDLRFGFRMLLKSKGLTATAVVALAMGIGLTTMTFSIVYGAFLRGLPFEEQYEIMHLKRIRLAEGNPLGVTLHDFVDWRAQQTSFEDLAAFYTRSINISGSEGLPERYLGAYVTAETFDLLRVQPLLGRGFLAGEDAPSAEPVAIIGERIWRNRYSSSPSVIGRLVRVNGESRTVVGVMPEAFRFPQEHHLWIPLQLDPSSLERGQGPSLHVMGRLKEGVEEHKASAELASIAQNLEQEYPTTNAGLGVVIEPYIHHYVPYEQRAGFATMLGAVFTVLLVACVNVANLLLARTAVRGKEVAVRSALGAGRWRLISQILMEAFALVSVGAVAGLGLAYLGLELFHRAIVDNPPPFWMDFRIDPVVAGFVVFLTLIASLLSGIAPAFRASGIDLNETLKDESRGASGLRLGRLSQGLVVAEIALSFGLLLAAGVLTISIINLKERNYPFATGNVFISSVALFESDYPDEESRVRFFGELSARLESVPGAAKSAIVSTLPGLGGSVTTFAVESRTYPADEDYPRARRVSVSPGTFETFGIEIGQGRDFRDSDDADSPPVAIVNESFAEKCFGSNHVLGKRIRAADPDSSPVWRTIVGIVPDVMTSGWLEVEYPEGYYVPLAQSPPRYVSLAILTPSPPSTLSSAVRKEVMALDPNLPIYGVSTLGRAISNRTWYVDIFGSMFVFFGIAALLLAAIGLYGVMSFSVSRRTHELGLRVTLGAQTGDVLKLVLGKAFFQLGIGSILGLSLGMALSHLVEGFLYGVGAWDFPAFLMVIATMMASGLVACIVPVCRALRIEPAVALRYE